MAGGVHPGKGDQEETECEDTKPDFYLVILHKLVCFILQILQIQM